MPSILIKNRFNKIVSYNNESQSILQTFQDQNIDWMHACGGKGRCTTCAFNVDAGMVNLSRPTHVEVDFLKEGKLQVDQRLACQTRCMGQIVIDVPEKNQLPHIEYGYE